MLLCVLISNSPSRSGIILNCEILKAFHESHKMSIQLTFTTAAAAPQTPSDNQTDCVLRRGGLALCCQGDRAFSRWRK